MKFILSLLLLTSVAQAKDLVLMDVLDSELGMYDAVDSKLSYDRKEVTFKATLTTYRSVTICSGGGWDGGICSMDRRIMSQQSMVIPGLNIVDDEVIVSTDAGDVNCGYVYVSRFFRNTKLKANGNCKLSVKTIKVDRKRRTQLVLKLKD